jgi:hypothetical protein
MFHLYSFSSNAIAIRETDLCSLSRVNGLVKKSARYALLPSASPFRHGDTVSHHVSETHEILQDCIATAIRAQQYAQFRP